MITKEFTTKNSFFKFLYISLVSFFMLNFLNLIVIKFFLIICNMKDIYHIDIKFTVAISFILGMYFFLFADEIEKVNKIGKNTIFFTFKNSVSRLKELRIHMQLLFFTMMLIVFTLMFVFSLGLSLYIYTIFKSKIAVGIFILLCCVGILSYILAVIKSQQFLFLNKWDIVWKK